MIRYLFTGICALAAFAGPTSAADYKAAPVFNWTGFYVGAHVGYSQGNLITPVGEPELDGIFGGVQAGQNWQISPNFLFGVEADLAVTNIGFTDAGATSNIDYLGTVRARLGIVHNNILLYATGGFAYLRNEISGGPFLASRIHTGYAVGAGFEWAVSRHWSAKLEYLYFDLGDEQYGVFPASIELNTVKFGMNYRF